jgi:Holliday junction resolvase RusA-like endonuclease
VIEFTVEGDPGPKGSRTSGTRKNGTTFSRPSSKRQKPWETAVMRVCADYMVEMLEPPYRVTLDFVMKRPKKPSWPWPSKDDLDKLERCTIDGLVKAGAILDDRHVIAGGTTKSYGDWSGCRIRVESINP